MEYNPAKIALLATKLNNSYEKEKFLVLKTIKSVKKGGKSDKKRQFVAFYFVAAHPSSDVSYRERIAATKGSRAPPSDKSSLRSSIDDLQKVQ